MLTNQEMFKNAMGRLAEMYKDCPAQLEAVSAASQIADTLMEGLFDRLGGSQGLSTIQTPQLSKPKQSNTPSGAATTPQVLPRTLKSSAAVLAKGAMVDPVAVKRLIDGVLNNAVIAGAQKKYAMYDNWEEAFKKDLSGELSKEIKAIDDADAAKAQKAAVAQEKADLKAGEQAAKQQNSDFWANQKRMDHLDKKAAADQRIADRAKAEENRQFSRNMLKARRIDPEMYKDTKSSFLRDGLNKLRDMKDKGLSKFHGWLAGEGKKTQDAIKEAIERNDVAMLESLKQRMLDIQTLCEASGLDVNSIFG